MAEKSNQVALPRWQSHKEVLGDKIISAADSSELAPAIWRLACGALIDVSSTLQGRVPKGIDPVGGYYVRYADGFESWSPAKAFEDGYTRI